MDRTEKLKELVNEAKNKEDFVWLENVQWQKIDVSIRDESDASPIENIKHTYSIRGKINQDRGNPVKGFEAFLRNLEITKTEAVLIHHMTDIDEYEYLVFTDPTLENLIGILRLVKQSEISVS
jgi:hypothetical protein